MTTVQKNFTITEGARNRLIVRLPEDVSASDYTVYAGNDKCKCRHLKYEVATVGEHHITLLSEPASPEGTIPYQIFIKDNNTDVEWLLASGNIIVIKRMVGIPGISGEWINAPIDGHDMEVDAPLDEQIIDIDVEITYTKEDLDEAVRKAIEAKEAACTYKTQACQAAGSAELYAGNASSAAAVACGAASTAHTWANSASSWANCAANYADTAYSWASRACQYKSQACCYKKKACEYNTSAQTSAAQADAAMGQACSARTNACAASASAYTWATNASTAAGEACSAANNASALKGETCCYKKKACTYSTQASSSAALASVSSSSAGSYKSQACCYKKKTCEYLDEVTGIAATKQDKLCAGTNITIKKVSDKTWICAAGGGGGDVYQAGNNNFTGLNTFNNAAGVTLSDGSDSTALKNASGALMWGTSKVLTSGDVTPAELSVDATLPTEGSVESTGGSWPQYVKVGSYWMKKCIGAISAISIKDMVDSTGSQAAYLQVSETQDFSGLVYTSDNAPTAGHGGATQTFTFNTPIQNYGKPMWMRKVKRNNDGSVAVQVTFMMSKYGQVVEGDDSQVMGNGIGPLSQVPIMSFRYASAPYMTTVNTPTGLKQAYVEAALMTDVHWSASGHGIVPSAVHGNVTMSDGGGYVAYQVPRTAVKLEFNIDGGGRSYINLAEATRIGTHGAMNIPLAVQSGANRQIQESSTSSHKMITLNSAALPELTPIATADGTIPSGKVTMEYIDESSNTSLTHNQRVRVVFHTFNDNTDHLIFDGYVDGIDWVSLGAAIQYKYPRFGFGCTLNTAVKTYIHNAIVTLKTI